MLGWKSQAVYQVSVLLVLKFQGRSLLNLVHDTSKHSGQVVPTMIFNSFILCQVIYLLIKLKEKDYYTINVEFLLIFFKRLLNRSLYCSINIFDFYKMKSKMIQGKCLATPTLYLI